MGGRLNFLILIAGAIFSTLPARAETWPARPIRFIVPFAPGGGGDVVGRIIGPRMSEQLGKPLVIDNRAGEAAHSVASWQQRPRPMAIRCCSATSGRSPSGPRCIQNSPTIQCATLHRSR